MELWSFSQTLGIEPGELRGMAVEARDGGIGKVVDLIDRSGAACLIIDTGPWIFGKKVMVPAGVVTLVDIEEQCVFIERTKDEVKNAPEHDPDATDDPARHDALTAHYGTGIEAEVGVTATSLGGLDDDSATVHRVDEAESPATAWERPEGSGPESLGSGTSDATQPPTDQAPSFPPDEGPQLDLATPPSADLTDEPPASREDAPAEQRFARDEDSGAGKAETTPRSGSGDRAGRKSSRAVPIAGYDSLTAAEVLARLPGLSQRELAEVQRYEKRHESRRTVLSRIESLREKEPWRGYDDEKVDQIRKKLADANDERARRVRDYERRHRDRKGVMEAARRAVASA